MMPPLPLILICGDSLLLTLVADSLRANPGFQVERIVLVPRPALLQRAELRPRTRSLLLHINAFFEFGDTAPVITAAAIIMGLMLSGVMADYKESEKLPGEIAGTLEAIDDLIVATALRTKDDLGELKRKYATLFSAVEDYMPGRTQADECYAAMSALASTPGITENTILRIELLRRSITRFDVIRRTSFIQTGYALLDVLVATTIILEVLAGFKTVLAQYLVVGAISFVYIYMVRLIRDLDNPFEYAPDGKRRGAAEVDLFPIQEARRRYESNVALP